MEEVIKKAIHESIAAKEALLHESAHIKKAAEEIINALKHGHKVLACGNGGSAADAQHFVAELVGRFEKERKALPAICLTTNTSTLTAISNDYDYNVVFKRQVEALGEKGDVLLGITTSGNSRNVLMAIEAAKDKGMKTICLTGREGGVAASECDIPIVIKNPVTARIQECHILTIHIICSLIDREDWK